MYAENADWIITRTGVNAVFDLDQLLSQLGSIDKVLVPSRGDEGIKVCRDTIRRWRRSIENDPLDNRTSRCQHVANSVQQHFPSISIGTSRRWWMSSGWLRMRRKLP